MYVAVYQLAMYAGIVFASMINGELLKRIKVKLLYSFGILVSGISMLVMMFARSTGIIELTIAGIAMGIAAGFFWTNRYLLALNATNDNNRNYFFGLESFFFSISSIIVPVGVGAFLAKVSMTGLLGINLDINQAYQVVTTVVFIITIIACIILSKGVFHNPEQKKYLYFKFDKLWNKLLALSGLKGLVQGFLVTAPAILVLRLVGDEGALGLIQGIAGLLTAILVYVLGRITKPKHRILVFAFGIILFFIGTMVNALLFSAIGVIVFVLCKVFFQPLHDLAYFPIMMRVIDIVSKKEGRNEYAYIMSHEIGLFLGRAVGLSIFILLAYYVSEVFALKYALVVVAIIQLLSIPLAKNIIDKNK
jgi:YQGE family putative transporter